MPGDHADDVGMSKTETTAPTPVGVRTSVAPSRMVVAACLFVGVSMFALGALLLSIVT